MTQPAAPEETFAGDDLDLETPESDALEQQADAGWDDDATPRGSVPLEADPADALDQDRTAGTDDDDYR